MSAPRTARMAFPRISRVDPSRARSWAERHLIPTLPHRGEPSSQEPVPAKPCSQSLLRKADPQKSCRQNAVVSPLGNFVSWNLFSPGLY